MIPVQYVILFTKISRIGNKVVCIYSGNFRLNYVFIQLQKDRHICLILLLYFLLHQRSFLNFVVKNFQDDFQYFIFELCFCILIFGYVVGHESGFKRWSSPKGGDPERIRIQAQQIYVCDRQTEIGYRETNICDRQTNICVRQTNIFCVS